MTSYTNLKAGAPRRLAELRRAAEAFNNRPHRNAAVEPATWREVRYVNFKTMSIGQGYNDVGGHIVPVWYSTGPVFNRVQWCDEIAPRAIPHHGWFADPDGCNTYRGFVVRLPHGRYMAGYAMQDNDEHVHFYDVYTDEREAALAADRHAERNAETEREYQTRWQEARDLENDIEEMVRRLRECIALRHRQCMAYVRDEIARLTGDIRKARNTLNCEICRRKGMTMYQLVIDASKSEIGLASIEQSGPVRVFEFPALRYAKAARNVGLFCAGESMRSDPRRVTVGHAHTVHAGGVSFTIRRVG